MPKYSLPFFFALCTMALWPWQGVHASAATDLQRADQLFAAGQLEQAHKLYDSLLVHASACTPLMLKRLAYMEENKGHVPETLYYLSLLYNLKQDEHVRLQIEGLARQYRLEGYDFDEWDFFRQLLRQGATYLLSAFLIFIALLDWVMFRRRRKGRRLQLLPLSVFGLLLVGALLVNVQIQYGKAIIMGSRLPIMEEPSAASAAQRFAEAGTRLTVIGEQDEWLRVVHDGKQGFVNRYRTRLF